MANSQTLTLNIKALFDASDVKAKVGDIQSSLSKLKLPDKLATDLNKSFTGVNKALDDFISRTEKGIKTKSDASGITKSFENVSKELTNLDNLMIKVKSQLGDGVDLSKIIKFDGSVKEKLENINKEITVLQQKINSINTAKLKQLETALAQITSKGAREQGAKALELFNTGDLVGASQVLDSIIAKLKAVKTANETQGHNTANIENNIKLLETMQNAIQDAQRQTTSLITEQNAKIAEGARIAKNASEEYVNGLNKQMQGLHQVSSETSGLTSKINDLASSQAQFVREVDQVKSRIQYFFGLSNAINLVKRAVRGAVETIKDLDKAMTETAVVTDFTVSDMWKQLPEYTKRANELGVTTQAAYEAATLYYQQGLNNEEVNALSVETLKMARIAGLDAAEATDRMTNALRGFNMELDTANAQRVDDVYSELAANTASNVDEISTAMTKVASLAHSANMEFETTAAFLAQIIETTRESAETAGTALKTVVARFSEVKKLVDENQLRGQDEEGQVVDVNKVSAALRTAGIDLNKYFLGEVGLDDIFMELASKWDSLNSIQQRYIATQAAGSRQQSRFIALMQDYARMQELVGKAYNAEGASAKQFEKTQESLESKLARLKNAWNEFLMGLTNNVMVKTFVDLLTDLLNLINKITSAFGDGAGSILKWTVALGTLGGLRRLFTDGGLATQLIGSLMGHGIGANKFRTSMGLGAFDQDGKYAPYTAEQLRANRGSTIIGGVGQLGKKAWGGMQKLTSKVWGVSGAGNAALSAGGLIGGTEGIIAGLTGITTALGAVAIAVGVVVAAYQTWLHLTPEGQLKQAKQIAKVMDDTAVNTQNAATEMHKARDSYQQYNDAIKQAKTVEEHNEAIQNRNDYINSLIQQNKALAEYVNTEIQNGQIVLTIDEAQFASAIDNVTKGATRAAFGAGLANAMQAGKQADVYDARIRRAGVNLEQRTIQEADGIIRSLTDAEYAKYSSYAQAASNARAEQRNYAQQAYGRKLADSGLEDEVANMLAGALADSFDEDAYLNKINANRSSNWWNGQATRKQLEAEYLRLFGTTADASMKRADLARAVAQGQADAEREEGLDDLALLLKGRQGSQYRSLLEAYQGKGQMAEINLEGISNTEDLAKLLGFDKLTDKELEDFATALGTDVNKLHEHIKAQIEANKQIQQQNRANIYEQLMRAGVTIDKATQERINGFTPTETAQVSDTLQSAQGLLTPELFKSFVPQLFDSVGTDLFDEINNLFASIDLNDPISAFNTLANAEQKASNALKPYIQQIRESNAELFTTSNLVQSFIISSEYDELGESVGKFIEENDRISADNIEELADSSKLLRQLLDNNIVSAKALANALTLVEKGKISFEQLTDAMLKALDAGTSFEEMMEEVNKWIEEFDPGTDLKEGTEHIVEQLENLKEYVSNWEFGNEPTKNIYEHIFGKGTYDELVDRFGNDFEAFEAFVNGKIEQYTHMAENAGLGGIQAATAAGVAGLKEIAGSGGQFFEWDLSQFSTTTEAITSVANALGVTQEAAEAFILSWQTHMPKLRTEWNELNYNTQLQAFANELGNTRVISQQQLDALGAAVGKTGTEVGNDLAQIIEKINEARIAAGEEPIEIPVIVNWKDDEGNDLTGDALKKRFAETFGTEHHESWGSYFSPDYQQYVADFSTALETGIEGTINGIDAQGLIGRLLQDGFSQAQANEMANNIASSLNDSMLTQTIEVPKLADDGITVTSEQVTVAADSMEGLKVAADAAIEAANYEIAAEKLAESDLSGFSATVTETLNTAIQSVADSMGGTVEGAATRVGGAISAAGGTAIGQIQSALASTPFYGTVILTASATQTGATGGLVRSLANGSGDLFLQPGFALTGEEGPEIVWNKNKGYAYITGKNGAEFQNLQPGDRVFNAAETSRIFRNSSFARGGIFDSYASGGWKPSGGSGGGDGGGSSSDDDYKKESTWRNELDWLYDLMEDIAEYERQQTIIQTRNEMALKDVASSGRDLYNLTLKELTNLETQLDGQQAAQIKRLQQMGELQTQVNAAGYGQYMQWNDKDKTLEIDWDAIEAIQDKETYDEVVDWLNRMEDVQDQIDDAEDAMWDIRKQIQDLQQRYLQQYLEFQNRVLQAVVKQYQDQIDKLSELNGTLNDTNTSILDSIQREIDLERQIRDNTDTESNIADMEARLAYLQRDTTGANDSEIRSLQKSLDEARESYSDNLVDQAIDRLTQSNEDAAAQREKQIEIMQAQLDYWQESGALWGEVDKLISEGFNGDGSLTRGSELEKVLQNADNYKAMSQAQRDNWANELILETNQVGAHILEMAKGLDVNAYQIRALLSGLRGQLGGTPEHSFTAVKTEEKYATGGLNTYTGLAHLDGTPSAPEYVLNPEQTNAFLRLADVLPSVMSGSPAGGASYGGNIYLNLDMHVDEIANDYDVDKIADRVKDILYNASSYRNVNTLNFIR